MKSSNKSVISHYHNEELCKTITETLYAKGLDAKTATDKLTGFDDLHLGGRQATLRLAEKGTVSEAMLLLDVGAGVGGPARTLAERFNCKVIGLELAESFCQAAQMLTQETGLADRVRFIRGDALKLPFSDHCLDRVWNQHFSMNIEDKERLFSEAYRVLKPGGKLLLHEVVAGDTEPPHYPVPWASDAAISFILPEAALLDLLKKCGFRMITLENDLPQVIEWYELVSQRNKTDGIPPVGQQMVMGDRIGKMAKNMRKNLMEDRVRIIQAVLEK